MGLKSGIMAAVSTVVVILIELILFPIALGFMTGLNSSIWVSSSDRTTLSYVPTLMIVVVLFTALGGMIASIYLGTRQG